MGEGKHPRPEGRKLIADFTARGWTVSRGKGYFRLRCPCGDHQKWIHLTPSGANYWLNLRKQLERMCHGKKDD